MLKLNVSHDDRPQKVFDDTFWIYFKLTVWARQDVRASVTFKIQLREACDFYYYSSYKYSPNYDGTFTKDYSNPDPTYI